MEAAACGGARASPLRSPAAFRYVDRQTRTELLMPTITVNAEPKTLPDPLTVADLLRHLGKDPAKLAVEVNRDVIPRTDHATRRLADGDAVEIVTLVGGGSPVLDPPADASLRVGGFTFRSRLVTGTGKYATYELMQQCMEASGCEVT